MHVFASAALSQIMLFVDGMNGVINHNETVQWLYILSGSLVRDSLGPTGPFPPFIFTSVIARFSHRIMGRNHIVPL